MPIYNGYPQVYYPQQPQGQLEQLRAAQYQPQPVMMPTMQGQAAPTDSGFIWVQGEATARLHHAALVTLLLEVRATCYTVADFAREYPRGVYVLGCSGHVMTVINGEWWDSWDSGAECPIYYWYKEE